MTDDTDRKQAGSARPTPLGGQHRAAMTPTESSNGHAPPGDATAKPRAARKYRRRGRGTLTIIVALLLASGILRLGLVPSEAFAIGTADEFAPEMAETDMTCGPGDLPAALMQALRAREERVMAREAQLADRLQALALAEAEIEEQLVALAEAEASLEAVLTIAEFAAQDDLDRLTTVYENMKPQDAAALFAQMEPAFSAGFMGRMNPTSAAAIMTNLQPEQAYLISVVLAGRNASVPTE